MVTLIQGYTLPTSKETNPSWAQSSHAGSQGDALDLGTLSAGSHSDTFDSGTPGAEPSGAFKMGMQNAGSTWNASER